MTAKSRIAKLEKVKPREELRRITKAYFDALSIADLERMRDNPETFSPEEIAEFNRTWDARYRVMTEPERARMDALISKLDPSWAGA